MCWASLGTGMSYSMVLGRSTDDSWLFVCCFLSSYVFVNMERMAGNKNVNYN